MNLAGIVNEYESIIHGLLVKLNREPDLENKDENVN